MKHAYVLMAASIGLLAACSGFNEIDLEEKTHPNDGELVDRVIFEAPSIRSLGDDDETRASLSQEGEGGIRFAWEATDTVGIYPDKGAQVYFSMGDGVGTNVASFDGGGWALRKGSTYSCYYPFVGNMYLDKDTIPVSFAGQEQNGISSYNGIRFFLASEGTSSSSSGELRFSFEMLNTVIRIKAINLPAGTYTKLSLTTNEDVFVQDGTFGLQDMAITGKTYSNTMEVSLKNFTLTEASTVANPAIIYLTSAPVDLTGMTVTVRAFSEDGVYICEKEPTKPYDAGSWGGLKCTMEKEPELNCAIYYTSSDGMPVTPNAADVFGAEMISNKYVDRKGVMVFDAIVTQIGNNAFENCETLTGITIPDSVTSIGDYAFSGCSNLGSDNSSTGTSKVMPANYSIRSDESAVIIPDGVTSIGAFAFQDCSNLTSITIPDTVTSIGEGAFYGCENLSGIEIPDSVTDMGENIFGGCTSLTSVTIPDGVTRIDDYAFAGCGNLISVDIPSTVTSIGSHAFDDCENLVSITIPDGVTRIEAFAFAACTSLPSINFPNGLKSIGSSAFENCFVLANVTLPSGVNYIGSYAFASCHAFTSFTIPPGITRISDGLFWNCSGLSSISIHENVESIESDAFSKCSSLTHISIPESVTVIVDNAFSESGLTSITIPKNVTSIGRRAFQDCANLTSITVHAATPPSDVSENTFENTNDCPIYVPSESVNAYKTATGWSSYASRICDHIYVEMGNGMRWATTNVGAIGPEDFGDFFAWGRTEPLVMPDANYSHNVPFVDTATEMWGDHWRMPTLEEWEALKNEENYTWTWEPAKKGYMVESKVSGYVGNKIFLPAAGVIGEPGILYVGNEGNYWASSLRSEGSGWSLFFDSSGIFTGDYGCGGGLSVRPVFDIE